MGLNLTDRGGQAILRWLAAVVGCSGRLRCYVAKRLGSYSAAEPCSVDK